MAGAERKRPSEYVRQQLERLQALVEDGKFTPQEQLHVAEVIAGLAKTVAELERCGD